MAKAREIKGIECGGTATSGIRLVLSGRFNEMAKLRAEALNWNDPEGVHSMRVASRRLRSALRDFGPFMRKRGLSAALRQVKQIADTLGAVRDQDVALVALEKLRSIAPSEVSALLGDLIVQRQQARNKSRDKLKELITKTRLRELNSAFATAIDKSLTRSQKSRIRHPDPTYIEMARSIILLRLEELEKLSTSLYRPWKVNQLHDMRIAAKRLRYAIELFQDCWEKAIAPFAEEVARLQASLGELHDCDVWIENFADHILESKRKDDTNGPAGVQSDAYAWLLSNFIETRNNHFRDAFDIWREWEARGLSPMLRNSITPSSTESIALEHVDRSTSPDEQKEPA